MSATSQKISAWLLVLLLPVAGYVGWNTYQRVKKGDTETDTEADGSAEAPAARRTGLATEEHWLVDETTRGIAEMLAFAKNPGKRLEFETKVQPGQARPGQSRTYDLQAKLAESTVSGTFTAKEYIWSPAEHVAWAQKLVGEWKLTAPAATAAPADFLATLTKATPEVLQGESKRLSATLTATPLDAALHDQAALVTLAFAMHEAARYYSDTRRELSRAAAHLSIARALQPSTEDPVRALADAALQTLAGRETPALQALASIPTDAPGAGSWVQVLRLRNTGNWKSAPAPTNLLETIEVFRARARSVNSHFAVAWLESQKPAPVHDFRRIVLDNGFGVEDGHGFAMESLKQEYASLQEDWNNIRGEDLDEKNSLKALSEPAGRAVAAGSDGKNALSVLGWDFWSAQHQRHLCDSVRATNAFLRDKWGVPEYREFQKFAKLNFPDLPLFPLVERDLTEDANDNAATTKRVAALIEKNPQLVSAATWGYARMETDENVPALGVSAPSTWFTPLLPVGTTYDIDRRVRGFILPGGGDQWWTRHIELAPSNYNLRYGQTWKAYGERPPAQVAEKVYAPLESYNLNAMLKISRAQKEGSPKYPETMQRVCELDAGYYFELGDWYLARKDEVKAADAYQKGVDLDEDRIEAANHCGWLVNYLEDQGLPERALAIATMAAEVYSYRGLCTMARLMERRGQLKEAEDYYEKIVERYEDHGEDLVAFYVRQRAKDPEFEKKAASQERRLFPDGMKKVTIEDFQGTPEGGTTLLGTNQHTNAAGLKKTDVIVALDGFKVLDRYQFMYIRSLKQNEGLQLIVWDGAGYRGVLASPPNRRFGVDIGDFKKR